MSWVLDLSILLSIFVCVYIYVRLIMSGYLFFCIYFNVWYITCYSNEKKLWNIHTSYKVIGEALVLDLVVVYKIPYSSFM